MRTSMPSPLRRRDLIAVFALAAAVPLAHAQMKIAGETFDARLRVGDTDLVLNGVGVRAVVWFKGYAAGLYLTAKAATATQVLATPGAKRLQLRMLIDVPAKEFVKAVDVGIARNTPEAEHAALAERQAAFDAQIQAIGTVDKGAVVDLDYLPGRGLQMSLNGRPSGPAIPGADFYAAVLLIFLGDKPVDKRLQAGLLGARS
jgi:hypothetical protein